MTGPHRLHHLNALLEQSLALPEEERAAWLDSLAREPQLVAQLRRLLARAAVDSDTFMRSPVGGAALDAALGAAAPEDQAGDAIGPYRLIRPLGSGGMSTVWLAARSDGSLQRRVALKLPRLGWSPGLAQRMARERDILAALEHPRIARLYDAGTTAAGRPWLAMEHVDGQPIDAYCTAHALPMAQRLRLVLQVADAVAHAHARLIVHRDLKPGNILVTTDGDVRLLDFGVARLLDGEAHAGDTPLTQLVGRAFTRDYASPEQIRGEPLGVASDVYSLAVVLYELLTSERPYRLGDDSAAALEEAILRIEVVPPSRRTRDVGADLDTVLAKALKKDAGARYASVDAFADDLRCVLERRPVSARPDAFGYRLLRFVQRNALAVGAVSAVVLALLGGAGTAAWQAREAAFQRDRALQELAFAEAADELMRYLLSERGAAPYTSQDILARAEQLVELQFAENAQLRARLQLLIADLHGELERYPQAEASILRAQVSAAAARDGAVGAHADCTLAALYAATGRAAQAPALFAAALRRLEAMTPPPAQALTGCHVQGGSLMMTLGEPALALAHAQAALDLIGTPRPGQRTSAIFLHTTVADAHAALGHAPQAIASYERAIDEFARIGRGNTTAAITLQNNLGVHLLRTGQPLKAAEVLARATRGDAVPDATAQTNYGRALFELGRDKEAAALFTDSLPRHLANGDARGAAYARVGLATIACRRLPVTACDAALAAGVADVRSTLPPRDTLFGIVELVAAQAAAAQPQVALARLDAALAIFDSAPQRNPQRLHARAWQARMLLAHGDAAGAKSAARRAVDEARAATQGIAHSEWLGGALLAQALVFEAQGEAGAARQALVEALSQLESSAGTGAPVTLEARQALAAR